ncbi:Mrx11p [Kluyveromyces lactis]|uniref:KLLA0D11836p n=2 Tax=Kluyveromyces lactis TaxID=28985 RepID=Q6CR50_KLULA|nr:uncharacterized protein KLLA0_D11836g [Kluyveromyces lactis]CAH00685.1 KLLA0D11836p [Kluyveromyces lactis]|eukprot:XP_453589.1 uncharacterized protein KLLA0_D11836g [Kluyveromyces lactis]
MKLLQSLPGLGTSCSKMVIGNRYSIIQKRGPAKLFINGIRYNSSKVEPSKIDDRLHRLIKKSKFLTRLNGNPRYKHYFDKLSEAGAVSTMTSFLILHEITAIVPLFALWGLLYNLDLSDQYEMPVYFKDLLNKCGESIGKLIGDYDNGWDRDRLVVSGALAYAIVKVLYPARILFSLWAAPYVGTFVIMPFTKLRALIRR